MFNNKKLIVITGPDGSGKSTLCEGFCSHELHVAGIWDALPPVENILSSKKDIDEKLCVMNTNERIDFLSVALLKSLAIATQREEPVILFNAYYYKYFVSELALNADPVLIDQAARKFPEPDMVIELQLTPELCAERKNRFSRYECGCSEQPRKETFLRFQTTAAPYWKRFRNESWLCFDARLTEKELKLKFKDLMKKL